MTATITAASAVTDLNFDVYLFLANIGSTSAMLPGSFTGNDTIDNVKLKFTSATSDFTYSPTDGTVTGLTVIYHGVTVASAVFAPGLDLSTLKDAADDYFVSGYTDPSSLDAIFQTINFVFNGSASGDAFGGGALADHIKGLGGNDTIYGSPGADTLDGGTGVNTLSYTDDSTGVTVDLSTNSASGAGSDADGDTILNFENVTGGDGDDKLTGGADANLLDGGFGADTLAGGAGNDVYVIDDEDDVVIETGFDTADKVRSYIDVLELAANVENLDLLGVAFEGWGNASANKIVGNDSDNNLGGSVVDDGKADTLSGGKGDDWYFVDAGDVVKEAAGQGIDRVYAYAAGTYVLSANVEELVLVDASNGTGNAGANLMTGNDNNNVLKGVDGNDDLAGGLGDDTLDGGLGTDTVSYELALNDVTVSLAAAAAQVTGDGADKLVSIENLTGSLFGDKLTGSSGANVLSGLDGADDLDGGAGTDTASYATSVAGVAVSLAIGQGAGGDADGDALVGIENLIGSDANDRLAGSAGNNVLAGGQGVDSISFAHATAGVTVSLALTTAQNTVGAGTDTLSGFENLDGSAFSDKLTGTIGNNVLAGNAGNDTLIGGVGADIMSGGLGSDLISYANSLAAVTIDLDVGGSIFSASGGEATGDTGIGIDGIGGSKFSDVLSGSVGAEFFIGGKGDDVINGEGGFDRADYSNDSTGTLGITVTVDPNTTDLLVTGRDATGIAAVGKDTLTAIEAIRGTKFADKFDVDGYTGSSLDAGVSAEYTQIEGGAGNDTITGSLFHTQVSYGQATAGVSVVLTGGGAGSATGDASVGKDTFVSGVTHVDASNFADKIIGDEFANVFIGRNGDDIVLGGGDDDTIYGGSNGGGTASDGFDTARYADATGDITVDLQAGTVSGSGVGNDTLDSIEGIQGGDFGDLFDASTFDGKGANFGSFSNFNMFEGRGGDDTIKGSGNTRVVYQTATGAVSVDLSLGTAVGDGSVGTDTLQGGIIGVIGSNFADTLIGSANDPATTREDFFGLKGNDTIDGGMGFDRADYTYGFAGTLGVALAVKAGDPLTLRVTGREATGIASVGTDTLLGIESVRGTDKADTFNVATYSGGSADVSNFFELEGMGGNDTFTGIAGGSTRVAYVTARAGVSVTLTGAGAGSAQGIAAGDVANVGIDKFTGGINQIRGSNFADILTGDANNNRLEGRDGDDTLTGGAGNNLIFGGGQSGGTANDGFDSAIYENAGVAITVNMQAGTVTVAGGSINDTLDSIESIRGSALGDVYDASTFDGAGANFGSFLNYNQFQGMDGDDTITGNGNMRVSYQLANGSVNVALSAGGAGSATEGTASNVGTDTFLGGVAHVRGSAFNDTLVGDSGNNRLEGDIGRDVLTGNAGADLFEYFKSNDGLDVITDFTSGTDRFRIFKAGFGITEEGGPTVFGDHLLLANYFVSGATPTEGGHGQFLFDTTDAAHHKLYWDADGQGIGGKVLIADVLTATVGAGDFALRS